MNFKKAWKVLFNKQKAEPDYSTPTSGYGELDETYLVDFTKGYQGSFATGGFVIDSGIGMNPVEGDVDEEYDKPKPPQKIKIKPIDVLNELETIPTPFNLNNLDDKILMLKDKLEYITQHYTKREMNGLIERLENRKQHHKHKIFFDQFQNTNDELIKKLLDKYDLVMKEAELFVPEFPDEAMKIMKRYTKMVKDICEKKPVFYVIAENKDFKSKYEKRDPILLVQSPFGFYWQILGAWDKEMLLLSEL